MLRIFYLSHAACLISDGHVQDILATSHRNNPHLGGTGVLMFAGGMFAQILEETGQPVLRLYVKVMADRRESDCTILHGSPASERIFQKWARGVIHTAPLEFQEIMDLKARRQEVVNAKVFSDAMIGFVRQLNAGA